MKPLNEKQNELIERYCKTEFMTFNELLQKLMKNEEKAVQKAQEMIRERLIEYGIEWMRSSDKTGVLDIIDKVFKECFGFEEDGE